MPESLDYEEFDVALLVGGLARHLSWKQIPPTHWYEGKGFEVQENQLVSARGYRLYAPSVLSPEYQDFFDLGSLYWCAAVAGVGVFYIHNTANPTKVIKTIGEWQFRAEADGDGVYCTLAAINVFAKYFHLISSTFYSGQTWQLGEVTDPDDPAHLKREYRIRRITPLVGTVHENCPVIKLAGFEQSPGTHVLYAHTTRDIYKYDSVNKEFAPNDRKTQVYTTGLARFKSPTNYQVTGAGTLWVTNNMEVDYLIKADSDTDNAWTRIESVDGEIDLTLVEDYRGASSGLLTPYTIIKTYASGAITLAAARTYRWSSCSWVSGAPSSLYICVNGYNKIQKHDGTAATMSDLTGLTALAEDGGGKAVNTARVVIPYMESLCIGGETDSINGYNPRRVRWSDPRDCQAYTAYKYRDLEGTDEIQAAEILGNTCVWVTTRGVHNQNFQASPIDFSFIRKEKEIGTNSPGTVKDTGDGYIRFLGPDDFYAYDLVRVQRFGQPIRDVIFASFNDDYAAMAEGHFDNETGLYLCSVPNQSEDKWNWTTFAFDVRNQRWLEPMDRHMCFGQYYESEGKPVIDDITDLIDSRSELIDARHGISRRVVLAGGRNGQVYQIFHGRHRDYSDPDASIVFGMTDFGRPGMKRLGWLTFTHPHSEASLQVYVGLSKNGERLEEWVGPLSYSLEDVPGEDRQAILTVDRKAQWFAFRFDNLTRNQAITLESLKAHFRRESRG